MRNLLACNLGSYRGYSQAAYRHLPEIGVFHVEIKLPAVEQVDEVAERLARHGLAVSSVQVPIDLHDPEAAATFGRNAVLVRRLGAPVVFTSVKAGDLDRQVAYERLRQIGDVAGQYDLIVCLETHPDLVTNGDEGRQTMEGVGHERVRINFDTANIYYYNQGTTAVEELEKVLPYVGAVHLKETNGGYKAFHFPALGDGVVDFKGVFDRLASRGFYGPYTMELEGIQGEQLSEADVLARVERSVHHLRQLGLLAA